MKDQSKILIVLEMANNHMGDVNHGVEIIKAFEAVSKEFPEFVFAFKFQFRNLDHFIHPDFIHRTDLKYIKRFQETRLTDDQFQLLQNEASQRGFKTMCTPFDEHSVQKIIQFGFDILKIASASCTDWPLLEEVVKHEIPVIASTGGVTLKEIDRIVTFFENRKKDFSLLHCVAEYPTVQAKQQLYTISTFRERYKKIRIGLSTHEDPENTSNVRVALGLGARIFEKHVGLKTEKYALNNYSCSPEQFRAWLKAIRESTEALGVQNSDEKVFNREEVTAVEGLRRYAFAKRSIKKGEKVSVEDVFFAIPGNENQIQANSFSKYIDFAATEDISLNEALLEKKNISIMDKREFIPAIISKVSEVLKQGNVKIPQKIDIEISHHYGIEQFEKFGCTIFNFINREYCKKLIICLPGQVHPSQFHKQKEEAFHLLHGTLTLFVNGLAQECLPGDIVVVKRGDTHSFVSQTGAVIEEISSTHIVGDSFYEDETIMKNPHRKTALTYWINT
jgi:sialic acid synthase SpsE/mannose-6-phosphate isomerase-like protein (cupin superfamily)